MEERANQAVSEEDLRSAQIAKLKLEIESLRKKNPWEPYAQFFPVAAAIVAFLGFSIGFIQFYVAQSEQNAREHRANEVEQRIRFQSQIRADGEALLRFVRNKDEDPAKVSFMFGILNATLHSGDKSIAQEYARPLTESLVDLIIESSGFDKSPRNVVFASEALDSWVDYEQYLREKPQKFNQILYEHTRAIRYLRDANPDYLQNLFYDESTASINNKKYENEPGEEARFQSFVNIWESFIKHVEVADQMIKEAKREGKNIELELELDKDIKTFQGSLCNEKIAPHVLNKYFIKNIRCELE